MSAEKDKPVIEQSHETEQTESKTATTDPEAAVVERAEIAIIDERTIHDKIYEVRGVKVMLDFELAEIYGYETKNFNRQVKNNAARFEGDEFMFQLTKSEFEEILRCKNFTSSWGGPRYLPHAFTEQGLYLLMTVLRGELAIRQSRALVMAFKAMKDYIIVNQPLASQRDYLRLSMQTTENTEAIRNVQAMIQEQQRLLMKHDDLLAGALEEIGETVKRSEISSVLLQFKDPDAPQEYLLLNNEPAKADETYISIYAQAKKTVFIVDNYINIKTLRQLQSVRNNVSVTVFSDNLNHNLHLSDYKDFQTEYPNIPVLLYKTGGIMHDRFIILDYNNVDETIFHCGASAKDAAVKLTTAITEITSPDMKTAMHSLIDQLLKNPLLELK